MEPGCAICGLGEHLWKLSKQSVRSLTYTLLGTGLIGNTETRFKRVFTTSILCLVTVNSCWKSGFNHLALAKPQLQRGLRLAGQSGRAYA